MSVSAVLLAGGESRRMGRDKATLIWNGRPLWQNQIELLQATSPSELLISARTDPAWRPRDARFVADERPSRGPLSGIAASLASMAGRHLLALAIDMPRMRREYLAKLCRDLKSGQGATPFLQGRAEPLCAVYPIEALDIVQSALPGTDWSLQTVAGRLVQAGLLRAILVDDEDGSLFCNLNSEDDLAPSIRSGGGAVSPNERVTGGS